MDDKYQNFGDNTMKDRVASQYKLTRSESDVLVAPSVFTSSGWDKYYFFSVPAGNADIHVTARKGRSRPAMYGPQTFQTEAFSPEEVAKARARLEGKGARTTYTESYSQLPRSTTAMLGPIDRAVASGMKADSAVGSPGSSRVLTRAASDTMLSEKLAGEYLAGAPSAHRAGPFWPPPGPERPDPLKTRKQLFQGTHRTIADLYARDLKPAPSYSYALTNY